MCRDCERTTFGRRGFLALAGMAGIAALLPAPARASGAATHLSPDEALEKLTAGNARYVADAEVCAAHLKEQRASVAGGQAPWASVLSCADSRVPPELVFGGLGLGELFVMRNAGNLTDTDVLGTLEYGADHLGVPLIVVMGHQRCGAVAAACDVVKNGTTFPGSIGPMIAPIVSVARTTKDEPGDFVTNTIKASARHTAAALPGRSEIVAGLVKAGKVKIVPAYYDLDSGKVEFLT
ncbi:carbonic anhydrase [Segnochrobactraceae bacterium EtOH-i3]